MQTEVATLANQMNTLCISIDGLEVPAALYESRKMYVLHTGKVLHSIVYRAIHGERLPDTWVRAIRELTTDPDEVVLLSCDITRDKLTVKSITSDRKGVRPMTNITRTPEPARAPSAVALSEEQYRENIRKLELSEQVQLVESRTRTGRTKITSLNEMLAADHKVCSLGINHSSYPVSDKLGRKIANLVLKEYEALDAKHTEQCEQLDAVLEKIM